MDGDMPRATEALVPVRAERQLNRGNMDQEAIDATTASLDDSLIALRRDLHAHPEHPGDEARTAAIVAELLTEAGLKVTTGVGGHGVVGILSGDQPGRTVAYRTDMDAVPCADTASGGPAHLCGHDITTAVGVGIAQTLARLRHGLAGTIAFVFQPAEETLTGAQAMLDDGLLALTAYEEIHALHCGPLPVGTFATTPGTGLPGQDRGVVTVTGPDARDRADRLADALRSLSTVAPFETAEDLEAFVDGSGNPDGPLARFLYVVAWAEDSESDELAEVQILSRCWPEEQYTEVRASIELLVDDFGAAQVRFPADPFPALVCPEDDAAMLYDHLERVSGPGAVTATRVASPFGGEDFGLFLNAVPGTYTYLGVRAPGADITTSFPHFPTFDPDERAIGVGVRTMSGWLVERARRHHTGSVPSDLDGADVAPSH
jgi:metal-dependent amidase/aminoacylase/carboxypeptidase family protein